MNEVNNYPHRPIQEEHVYLLPDNEGSLDLLQNDKEDLSRYLSIRP